MPRASPLLGIYREGRAHTIHIGDRLVWWGNDAWGSLEQCNVLAIDKSTGHFGSCQFLAQTIHLQLGLYVLHRGYFCL